jgi:hypothetical protein
LADLNGHGLAALICGWWCLQIVVLAGFHGLNPWSVGLIDLQVVEQRN